MPHRQLTQKLVTWFLNDNPDLAGEAANFHSDGKHLFVPEHLGERFQRWLNRVIGEHAPDDDAADDDTHTAQFNEFLAEHPQHIAGTRTMVVNGEEQVMADPEALRAFFNWAKNRGLCLDHDKADSVLAELDRLAARRPNSSFS